MSGGVTVRLDVTEPAGVGPFPALLVLHGAGSNVGFWLDRMAPFSGRFGVAIYAVHYFDRTGTVHADPSTIRDGRHVPLWLDTIRDALSHIAARPKVDPKRIALIGISLGAFLALALGAEMPSTGIRAIVDISGGLAEPYASQASAAIPPTLIVHGDADSVVPISHATELDRLLHSLGVPHRTEILQGEGHWFSGGAQLRILTAVASFLGSFL